MSSFLLLACLAPSTADEARTETPAVDSAVIDDSGQTGGDTGGSDDTGDPPEVPDYSQPGPLSTSTHQDTRVTTSGCTLVSTVVAPEQPVDRVILLHGFMRSGQNMLGWAEHLASWGLEVQVPDLCWSGLTPNPELNAQDVLELAGGEPVALVGHSAGGLSALIAGASGQVKALVGLDPVEQQGQDHSLLSGQVSAPTLALFGSPGSCNAEGNGVALYLAVPGSDLYDLVGAGHCDFESPTDGLCEAFCAGPQSEVSDESRRQALAGLVTAWVLQDHIDAQLQRHPGVLIER